MPRNHEKIVPMDVHIAFPYDLYLNELHDRKQEIYSEVNFKIFKIKVFRCEILPFIVGSTGLIHKKCLQTLMSLDIPKI